MSVLRRRLPGQAMENLVLFPKMERVYGSERKLSAPVSATVMLAGVITLLGALLWILVVTEFRVKALARIAGSMTMARHVISLLGASSCSSGYF